ncbi:MAG: BlaI/MecI/CopY family transcriptional regulator [Verrucomicrobiota bacterium]
MSRPASKEPTEAELRILKAMWKLGEPCRLSELCEELNSSPPHLATTTVATTLKAMSRKKLVKRVEGQSRTTWEALVAESKARDLSLRRLAERLFDGSSRGLVTHLVESGSLSEDDRREIARLLQKSKSVSKKASSSS